MRTRKPGPHIKKLQRIAKRDDMDIWFEDECHFQQHGSRCTMWVPPENIDPIVLHAPTRKHVGVFGAASLEGRFVFQQQQQFNAETFLCFLKQLIQHRRKNRKMFVVTDNARWHHAIHVRPWLKENKKIIQLDFLPPYSPDLNHIERVWKLARHLCTHNRYFSSAEVLAETVFRQFTFWSKKDNQTLAKLCAII